MATRGQFFYVLNLCLRAKGYNADGAVAAGFLGWSIKENNGSAPQAAYNPLNTTEPMPGATNFNSVGVKNYTSLLQGVAATLATLENGRYPHILAAVHEGGCACAMTLGACVAELDTWGTGDFSAEIPYTGHAFAAALLLPLGTG